VHQKIWLYYSVQLQLIFCINKQNKKKIVSIYDRVIVCAAFSKMVWRQLNIFTPTSRSWWFNLVDSNRNKMPSDGTSSSFVMSSVPLCLHTERYKKLSYFRETSRQLHTCLSGLAHRLCTSLNTASVVQLYKMATHLKISERWCCIMWIITEFSGSTPVCRPLCSKQRRKFVQTLYALKSQFIGHVFVAEN